MKNKLMFFLSQASFMGIGFYLIFSHVKNNAWVCIILGSLIGIIILYILNLLREELDNNVKLALKKLQLLGVIYKGIFIILYSYFIIIVLSILPLFVNSFYLVQTPVILIILPFVLTSMYLAKKGNVVLERLSNLLFVFSVFLIICTFFALISYIEIDSFLPLLVTTKMGIVKGSLIFAALSSIPYLITINYSNKFKSTIKLYIISVLSLLLICFTTTGILGETLISIYSFPEYIVLKRINLFNFIENVENILSFIWYFNLLILCGTCTLNIKNIVNKRVSYYIIMLVLIFISIFIFGYNYIDAIYLFTYYPITLFIFFFIFVILLVILKIKKAKCFKSI